MTKDLIDSGKRQTAQANQLQDAVGRQLVSREAIRFQQVKAGEHLAVTDRRLIITRVGSWLGERSQSVVLSAITSLDTHVRDGKIILLQISVPGRTWGEISLSGDDLSPLYHAIIDSLPHLGASS